MNNRALLEKINRVSWYHSFHLTDDIKTPGIRDCGPLLKLLDLPLDCHGLRVLDLGTADGFFSFELERRGAEVVSVDYKIKPSFLIAKDILKSKIQPIHANIYSLNKEKFGKFDIVLFLGVLYHLRNPLLALDRIRSVCRSKMYVETTCIDNNSSTVSESGPSACFSDDFNNIPLAQFHPLNSLNNDYTNYWSFNSAGLNAVLEEALFKVVKKTIAGQRCLFECDIFDDENLAKFIEAEAGLWPFDPV